jgi:hypothetical protein
MKRHPILTTILSLIFVMLSIQAYDNGTIGLTQLMIQGAIAFVVDAYAICD